MMTEENQLLKNEDISVKASHASLYQQAVDRNAADIGRHSEAENRITRLEELETYIDPTPDERAGCLFAKEKLSLAIGPRMLIKLAYLLKEAFVSAR